MAAVRDDLDPTARPGLWRATGVVHWFVVVTVLMALTALPTAVVVPLLAPDLSNAPLLALALVPVGPTLGGAVFAWNRFLTDRDDQPARHFLRGYRLNVVDTLRVWVPVLAVLAVVGVNVAHADALPLGGAFATGGVVIAVVLCVWAAHALVVTSLFAFRARDVARLAAYFLVVSWRATLNALALLVVVVGAVVLVSDWVVLLLAAPATYLLVAGSRPMTDVVRRRFVATGEEAAEEPAEEPAEEA